MSDVSCMRGQRIFVQTAIASQPIEYASPSLLKDLVVNPVVPPSEHEPRYERSLTLVASYPLLDLVLSQSAGKRCERSTETVLTNEVLTTAKYVRDLIFVHAASPISNVTLRTMNGKLRGISNPSSTPYRSVLTWVGGQAPAAAALVPAPPCEIEGYVSDLIEFITKDDLPEFVSAAMTYYQFLTVHPFKDANGRVGRLLIALRSYQRQKSCSKGFILAAGLNSVRYAIARHFSRVFDGNADEYIDFWRKLECWSDVVADFAVHSLIQMRATVRKKLGSSKWGSDFVRLVELSPIFSYSEFRSITRGSDGLAQRHISSLEDEQVLVRVESVPDDKWMCAEAGAHWERVRRFAMRGIAELSA